MCMCAFVYMLTFCTFSCENHFIDDLVKAMLIAAGKAVADDLNGRLRHLVKYADRYQCVVVRLHAVHALNVTHADLIARTRSFNRWLQMCAGFLSNMYQRPISGESRCVQAIDVTSDERALHVQVV